MSWLSDKWKQWCDVGMRLPFMRDPTTQKPSITLFFPYATFALAVVSLTALHFRSGLLMATWTAIGFWIIAVVLYMLRKITRAKFDLDDKSIDLSNEEEPEADKEAPKSPASSVTDPDA